MIMGSNHRKTPNEYPLFAFRIESKKKKLLSIILEDIRNDLNKKLKPKDKLWMKNDVIYEALMIGLPILKDNDNLENVDAPQIPKRGMRS
jgi:hypothetical protein